MSHSREYGAKAVGNARNVRKSTLLNCSSVPAESAVTAYPSFVNDQKRPEGQGYFSF